MSQYFYALHICGHKPNYNRGVINGKAGKAAALPKYLDMLAPRIYKEG